MKTGIFVVSDTHKLNAGMETALWREQGNFDYVIHLGDIEGCEREIREMVSKVNPAAGFITVRGNCDEDYSVPAFRTPEYRGVKIFAAHGHRYYNKVPGGPFDALASAAAGEGCRIALFGHTHRPHFEKAWNGVILINPGSISLPRQEDRRHGYGILTVADSGMILWEQKYLETPDTESSVKIPAV